MRKPSPLASTEPSEDGRQGRESAHDSQPNAYCGASWRYEKSEARVKYDEQNKAMRASRDAANKKLQEIRTASESAWQKMQAWMDSAWTSMKNALDKATSQFKK